MDETYVIFKEIMDKTIFKMPSALGSMISFRIKPNELFDYETLCRYINKYREEFQSDTIRLWILYENNSEYIKIVAKN